MKSSRPTATGAPGRAPWPGRLMAAAVAGLLTLPGAAHPISLSQLLRLPLEELLRLEISAPQPTPRPRPGAIWVLPAPADRGRA